MYNFHWFCFCSDRSSCAVPALGDMLGAVSLCVGGAGGLLVVSQGPPGAPGVAAETDQHWVRPSDGRGGDGVC